MAMTGMALSGRPFGALVIFAGMAPFIALSFLSLAQSSTWLSWSDSVSGIYRDYPIWRLDVALLGPAGSWMALAVAGGLLLLLALASRSERLSALVAAATVSAQLPGILFHADFQWGWLSSNGDPFPEGPGSVVAGLALAAAVAGIYSLITAAALERVGKTLVAGKAGPDGIVAVHFGNSLLLLGVMALIMAVGAVALIPLVGIPGVLTDSLRDHPAVVTWASVVGFGLLFGFAYSFIHRRWWSRADSDQNTWALPGLPQPTGPDPGPDRST